MTDSWHSNPNSACFQNDLWDAPKLETSPRPNETLVCRDLGGGGGEGDGGALSPDGLRIIIIFKILFIYFFMGSELSRRPGTGDDVIGLRDLFPKTHCSAVQLFSGY